MSGRQSQAAIKAHFRSITNALSSDAAAVLEKYHWDLQEAVLAFLSDPSQLKNVVADPELEQLYNRYCDRTNPTIILIDGTLQYLADLGLDPEDPRSLTLAYILKSPQTGEFRRSDWEATWMAAGLVSLPQMRAHLDACHHDIYADRSKFEVFYRYVFDFLRGADTRVKSIPAADSAAYWRLLLPDHPLACAERVRQWCEFVEEGARPVTKDTWNMWYKFYAQVVQPDPQALSAYDEMSAWPSLVDEYVEWLRDSGRMAIHT